MLVCIYTQLHYEINNIDYLIINNITFVLFMAVLLQYSGSSPVRFEGHKPWTVNNLSGGSLQELGLELQTAGWYCCVNWKKSYPTADEDNINTINENTILSIYIIPVIPIE